MTDTPDNTPDPNDPPKQPEQPATPPLIPSHVPQFFRIPPMGALPIDPSAVPTPQPAPQPESQVVMPGVMAHPSMEHMVEISAHAGIVQIAIRPSGAWMRVPCQWVPQLITRIEAARDAAALMQSAIEMGTGNHPVKRS